MRCAGAVGSHRPAGGPAKRGIDPCLRALGKSRAAGGSLSGSVSASLRVAARVSLLEGALILRASEKKERQFRTAERESGRRSLDKPGLAGDAHQDSRAPSPLRASMWTTTRYVDNGRFAGHCAGCAKQLNGGEPAAKKPRKRNRKKPKAEWV